jgi:DNA-binding MarR family transcriptional regulator
MGIRVFPVDESPGFLIYRLKTQLAAALQRAFQTAGHDVTPEQWGVLSRLWAQEGIHQSELAQRAEKDRHNMTRILNLLERNGFIERRPSPEDRRIFRVFLTQEGRDLQGKLAPIVIGHLESAFAGLTATDLQTMRRIHSHILENLEKTGCRAETGRTKRAQREREAQ